MQYASLLDNEFVFGYIDNPNASKSGNAASALPGNAWNGAFFVYDRTGKEASLAKLLLRTRMSEKDAPKISSTTIAGISAMKMERKSGTSYWTEDGKYAFTAYEPAVFEQIAAWTGHAGPQSAGLALTAAYRDPISRFTGRWIDSTEVIDFQGGFPTGRAYKAAYSPQKDRIYMEIGSGMGVYSRSTFFSRLEGREPLTPISQFPFLSRLESLHAGNPELVLRWDQWFYAESTFSNWKTVVIDGQDRISGFSIDDRGWVYLANSVFGWGMLKDTGAVDGSIMQGKQFFPAQTTN